MAEALRPELETGIADIDAQHQVLFQAVGELQAGLSQGLSGEALDARLAFLAQRTIDHFQTEETLMKVARVPDRADHAARHQELILRLREVQYQHLKGRPVPRDLAEVLADWLDHHVREQDMAYVAHLRAGRAR